MSVEGERIIFHLSVVIWWKRFLELGLRYGTRSEATARQGVGSEIRFIRSDPWRAVAPLSGVLY